MRERQHLIKTPLGGEGYIQWLRGLRARQHVEDKGEASLFD